MLRRLADAMIVGLIDGRSQNSALSSWFHTLGEMCSVASGIYIEVT